MPRLLALLALSVLLAGCPTHPDPCSQENQKSSVLGLMRSWYLYPELLRSIDPSDGAYPTVNDYLAALTADARAQRLDRGWTYATTLTQTQQYYDAGTSTGFGIGILERQDAAQAWHVYVSQVFPGSAAADAGFARGDEILAIGETPAALVDVPTILAGATDAGDVGGRISGALGPSTAGLSRTVRVLTLGGATVDRTMTKRTYALDPVPQGWRVIRPAGSPPVGYVALRTFIGPADPLLQDVFAQFQLAGVHDVIVDLRYNGGGLISTAELLSNLLAGDLAASDVMYHVEFNPSRAAGNEIHDFAPATQSVAATRVAFITTGGSASASEIVPNVLEPYRTGNIALVGAKTYGKPVGQAGFALSQCDLAVYLIALRLTNKEGEGGYYDGLPDANGNFSGPLCAAEDDLTHAMSDEAEASTQAALQWLATGMCPAAPAAATQVAPTLRKAGAPAPDAYPDALQPDEAQRNVRGLF
jgi:carboxyl-terminal processing protease